MGRSMINNKTITLLTGDDVVIKQITYVSNLEKVQCAGSKDIFNFRVGFGSCNAFTMEGAYNQLESFRNHLIKVINEA